MTVLINSPINTEIVDQEETCWRQLAASRSAEEPDQEEPDMIGQIITIPSPSPARSPRAERGSRRSTKSRKAPKSDLPVLTKQQSRQLRRGVKPKGVNWSEVKLSRRQQHWLKQIRRRAKEAKLARQQAA